MNALELVLFCLIPTLVLLLVLFSLRRELADNWPSIAFLAAACVLFFHRIIIFREALSQDDANLLQVQFFSVFREAVRAYGEMPFWNPYQGAGLPNLAHPLSAMFYPLTPVFLAGSIFEAMNIFVVCHYFLAGVFALLLGRAIFRSRQAALAFAVLYAFNGWAITRAAQQPAIEYVFAYAWLPLVALAFERAIAGKGVLASIAAAGAGLAWMGVACPNMFVFAAVLLATALVLRLVSLAVAGQKNALATGVTVAVGAIVFAAALGAAEYLPARELSAWSTYGRMGARMPSDWRGQALPLWTLVKLYFPFSGARPFAVYYSCGALATAAALYGLYRAVRARYYRDLAVGSAIVLTIGVGLLLKTELYGTLAAKSDIFARASLIPAGLMLLFLPVVALSAVGVEALVEGRRTLLGALGYALPALIFLELFVGLGVVYPHYGDRRLTFDYVSETADFPHLAYISAQGDAGRILVKSPEGESLAPSYATMPLHIERLNLHASAFAPDALKEAIDNAVDSPSVEELDALGVGWVVSTEDLPGLNPLGVIPWPDASRHFEGSIHFPLHNIPGWLAWDKRVWLYRVSDTPALVRAEPLSRGSILAGRSSTPREELAKMEPRYFGAWEPVTNVISTMNTITVILPDAAPTRYFFAVTAYPGWRFYADGEEVEAIKAATAFMAVDVPQGTRTIEAVFTPTHWRAALLAALAALIFAAVSVGGQVRFTAPRNPLAR